MVKQLEQGYRLPCPDNIKDATDWNPEVFYDELAKICYLEDPDKRSNFSEVVKVIENQLFKNELAQFERMEEEYQETRTNNYLKFGESE